MSCSVRSCLAPGRGFSSRSVGVTSRPFRSGFTAWSSAGGSALGGLGGARSAFCYPSRGAPCRPRMRAPTPCMPTVPCGPLFGPCGPLTAAAAPCGVLLTNEKEALQDLNERLAGYLDKVRYLEQANQELECKIKEFRANSCIAEQQWEPCMGNIEELMGQVEVATLENTRLVLEIDNARLASEDFRVKWEAESALRETVEADAHELRRLSAEYCACRNQLACEQNVLQGEIHTLKSHHRGEMESLRMDYSSSTTKVEMDNSPGADTAGIISEIRAQYETMIHNNRHEAECMLQSKLEAAEASAVHSHGELAAAKNQAHHLRQQYQTMEVEMESLRSANATLEDNLAETEERFSVEVRSLAEVLSRLEAEYSDVRANVERQLHEYESLLNIKMGLEMEISTYKCLIEGEDSRLSSEVRCNPACCGSSRVCTSLPMPCGSDPCSLNVCSSGPVCTMPCLK
uniref:Keratin, type I cytoskeletal 19-like n=1 Tax=Petromyzon marinus TaxID=7757 RepID=A0AAJ7UBM2_PETMA|nr:keratin, type I cytoskeletal 19-like [Petromyzon marinus]